MLEEFRKQRAAALYDGRFSPPEVEFRALVDDALARLEKAPAP